MENFLLQIDFASPMILKKPWLVGDSLLAGLLNERYEGDYTRAIADLPIATIEGVPQMSVMLPYSLASREIQPVIFIRNIMRDMTRDCDLATILNKMPTRSDLDPSSGPLANVISSYSSYDIPKIYFIGRGDISRVGQIMADADFIGPQKKRGYGEVANVSIRAVESDNRWFGMIGGKNGRNYVLRPIPMRLRGYLPDNLYHGISSETWKNPYFSEFSNAIVEPCLVPAFDEGEAFYAEQIENELAYLAK